MNEERKQELKQLLGEAMESLEIRGSGAKSSLVVPVDVYRMYLQKSWTSYSANSLSVLLFKPNIVSETTKSKLLDFIRAEYAPFIHEDWIQSASFFIAQSGFSMGYPLDMLLEHLLRIAIVRGIEEATSVFDRCSKDTHGSFQYMALLEGITLEAEIQAFEGMRLVPLPHSSSELPHYLPDLSVLPFGISKSSFVGKTLLIIDGSVSPIFQKPFPNLFREGFREDNLPFRVEVNDRQFPNFKVTDFYEKFCQALSVACNSAVQISLEWRFLAEDELFNLTNLGAIGVALCYSSGLLGSSLKVGQAQINGAKCLYDILTNLDSKTLEKLQLSINRWIRSKASGSYVDKMIDLGIAFEALYVPDGGTEITFKLATRAAWHLGTDRECRKKLLAEFKEIYNWRSKAVHTGALPKKKEGKQRRRPYTEEDIAKFIERAQDLCRQSILKILETGEFPNWNDLILG